MKRFSQVFAVIAAGAVLLLGTPQKAHAQFAITDPLGLAQQILQIFQDADMEGLFSDVNKLQEAGLKIKEINEKLAEVKQIAMFIKDGASLVGEVAMTVDIITETCDYVRDFSEYFNQLDLSDAIFYANICNQVSTICLRLYNKMERNFNSITKQIRDNSNRSDSNAILQSMTIAAREFRMNVSSLSYICIRICNNQYAACRRIQMCKSDRQFSRMLIF